MRVLALGVVCLVGCSPPLQQTSGAETVEEVLETAIAAGHAAALTMFALEGEAAPCLHVVTPCAGDGCEFTFEIDTGTCPIPISAGAGLVVVAGVWSSSGTAVISAGWGNLDGEWVIVGMGSMVVTRNDPESTTVAWAQQEVEVRDGADSASAHLEQHAWVVEVGTSGTKDPSDDSYTVSGGDQEAGSGGGGAGTLQVAIADATVTPACRRNPTSGTAVLQRVSAGGTVGINVNVMTFHDTCDGQPFDLTN